MKTTGLRGKSSPMNRATPEQRDSILGQRAIAERSGVNFFEVRYSTYIGPGCAAEHGAITVVTDGRIAGLVWKDGVIT